MLPERIVPDRPASGDAFRVSRASDTAFVIGNGEVEVVCDDYEVAVRVAQQANLSRRSSVPVNRDDLLTILAFVEGDGRKVMRR